MNPLDSATVKGENVILHQNVSGQPVIAATVTLVRGGRVVHIVPDAPLLADTPHFVEFNTNIHDLDGDALRFTSICILYHE